MANQPIIVTGANGFVGSEIIRALYEEFAQIKVRGIKEQSQPHSASQTHLASESSGSFRPIICVVRKRFGMTPAERMRQVFARWAKAGVTRRDGDDRCFEEFVASLICVDWEGLREILAKTTGAAIVHAAADTAFDLPIEESRRINVGLTRDLLAMSAQAARVRPECVERFLHVSTAFVAGKTVGKIVEPDRNPDEPVRHQVPDFYNAYEQSKHESEMLVRSNPLPWTIIRPAIVVGDSRTGFTLHFRVVYSVIRLWLRDVVPRAPLDRRARVDLVPSDHVARAILGLARLPLDKVHGRTVHVSSGDQAPGPVEIMMAASRAFSRPPLPLSPPWVLRLLLTRPILRLCSHQMREILKTVAWHMPYLGSRKRVFDNSSLQQLLGPEFGAAPKFSEYGDRLFEYCAKTSWGRKCSTWI